MTKAAPIALALSAMLVLAGSAGGTSEKKKKKRATIANMSHTHPDGANTSLVCAKVRKKDKARALLRVSGPGANVPDEVYFVTLRGKGVKTASFEISQPGPYKFRLSGAGAGAPSTKTYTVPGSPPANGPFVCPQ